MNTFSALAEPNRRRLLDSLLHGPQPVSVLVEAVGMSQPVVSKHLRVLREAGLVSVQPDGQRRLYRINAEPLTEIDAWLEPYRTYRSEKLDALERHLDRPTRSGRRPS
jgi:DNA-binding transcriptional ArsR family regulator